MKRVFNIFILVCIVINSFSQENLLSFFDSEEEMLTFLLLKQQKLLTLSQ